MLNIIRKKVDTHQFTTLDELRQYIDHMIEECLVKGRHPKTIRIGHSHRASV